MRLVVLGQLAPSAEAALRSQHEATIVPSGEPAECDIASMELLVTRGHVIISSALLARAPHLRLIVKAGAGLDTIDLDAARRGGIRVIASTGSSTSVAELTLALLLDVRRRVTLLSHQVRIGDWAAKYRSLGHTLNGSSLGILGLGRIGRAVAGLAAAFGMSMWAYDRSPYAPEKREVVERYQVRLARLDDLLGAVDALSLHLPLTEETHHLLGRAELARMREGSVLVNTARGALVDEGALLQALEHGPLAGAGLDVFEREPVGASNALLALPQVVATPHVGAQTVEAQEAIGRSVVSTIEAFAAEGAAR
jgi:phosphoglycerate dehydrogenase-like enzyme